jgi:predicted MPP superfamily phosphohydrolase
MRQACAGIAPDEAQIILSHNPRMLHSVAHRRCLLLAGHTHGGQVHLPVTNFRRRPADMRGTPWYQGWYGLGRARMYVNAGVGSVHFPMRLRCPPEIAVFTLVSSDAQNLY